MEQVLELLTSLLKQTKELNILTVGVTTLPFDYEGSKRMRRAIEGLEALKKHLDTTIVVPNQNLLKLQVKQQHLKNLFTYLIMF